MKINTQDLTGAALDWAVAKCEGELDAFAERLTLADSPCFYSTDWSQGGPIIERERIELNIDPQTQQWVATRYVDTVVNEQDGPTPLIAAMRCFVSSRLGESVDVPDELVGE